MLLIFITMPVCFASLVACISLLVPSHPVPCFPRGTPASWDNPRFDIIFAIITLASLGITLPLYKYAHEEPHLMFLTQYFNQITLPDCKLLCRHKTYDRRDSVRVDDYCGSGACYSD